MVQVAGEMVMGFDSEAGGSVHSRSFDHNLREEKAGGMKQFGYYLQ